MNGRLVNIKNLRSDEREAMYALLSKHFEGVRRDVFDLDLERKNWVVLMEDEYSDISANTLRGFSTFLMYEIEFDGKIDSVVYSGDTIIDPSAWSSSVLSRTWISAVNMLRQEYTKGKLYWFLLCSGYRTYRFLPTFCREFYPHHDKSTPSHIEKFMQFLASDRFGRDYDNKTGVVRFPYPHTLQGELKGIPEERLKDAHIRFFDRKNPGHLHGDNLICLAEIGEDNLTQAGKRLWFANTSPLAV
jgi:hypothetical protein